MLARWIVRFFNLELRERERERERARAKYQHQQQGWRTVARCDSYRLALDLLYTDRKLRRAYVGNVQLTLGALT